jgi:hypothetical protein
LKIVAKDDRESRVTISHDLIDDMLDCMDSEWDKKVLKVLLGATQTRAELTGLGVGSRIQQYTECVFNTLEERKKTRIQAEQLVLDDLKRKAENISKKKNKEEFRLSQKMHKWTETQLNELREQIEDLNEQHANTMHHIHNNSSKGFKQIVKRKQKRLITEGRIGMRKTSQGRPQMMDEADERYVMQCIERKATAHGRRHDNVMYLNHRVKKKDFLRLANRSRMSRGLRPIKSTTTVLNRARPKYRRSIQARRHLGLGLFCSKKPPKLQDNENILTHHQRAFKKGILMKRCRNKDGEGLKHNLFISRDDKAYICPGTSTGKLITNVCRV